MPNPLRTLVLVVIAVLLIAACGSGPESNTSDEEQTQTDDSSSDEAAGDESDAGSDGGTDSAAADDTETTADDVADLGAGLTAAAPVYPLAWVAQQIAPGAAVELLTGAGDEAHDIELTPRGRELVETADIVLYMGAIDYQPQIETAVEAATGQVVSFADVVGLDALREWDDDDHDDDDHDDDGHDHDHDGDEHDHGLYDPHAWFDAELMARATEAIGAAFGAVDSANAAAYTDAAAALATDFRTLGDEIAGQLSGGCAFDRVIVSHEAFSYLLEPYGFDQEGVSGAGGHGAASPQRIGELVTMARDLGIAHVLAEPVEGRTDAEAVAQEAGLEVLDVYSLEVVDDGDLFEQRGFLALLGDQAEAAAIALGCE